MFTAGTLRAPGKLAVLPILFAAHDESETTVLVHVGRSLCVCGMLMYTILKSLALMQKLCVRFL